MRLDLGLFSLQQAGQLVSVRGSRVRYFCSKLTALPHDEAGTLNTNHKVRNNDQNKYSLYNTSDR